MNNEIYNIVIYDVNEIVEGDYLCTYFKICDDECPIPHWVLFEKERRF